jgi:methyl-accepting chemotaxis protein
MFKKFSLKWKMILAFLGVSTLLIVQAMIAQMSRSEIAESFHQVSEVNLPNLIIVSEFSHLIQEGQGTLESLALAKDPKEADEFAKHIAPMNAEFAALDKKYQAIPSGDGEQVLYEPLVPAWKAWMELAEKAIEMHKSGERANDENAFRIFVMKDVLAAHEKIEGILSKLKDYHVQAADKAEERGKAATRLGETLAVLMIALGILMASALGFIFSTALSKQLRAITDRIDESAGGTATASSQLQSASQQLSEGSANSAASLEETVASLEELSSMVKTNSDHAKEANALSQKSKESAEHGEKEIARLIQSMSAIASGSKKIEEIISVIDDIAFQTNLLALNAAVEAARAGEQGKGFAVVAEAVRALAQRSAVSAKDIASLIKENVSQSVAGAKVAEVSGVVLTEIVTNVKKVSDLNNEISTASQEQATGIEQISKAMNSLDRATQENASSSEEVSSSSKLMAQQSGHLMELVGELRTLVDGDTKRKAESQKAKVQSANESGKSTAASTLKSASAKRRASTKDSAANLRARQKPEASAEKALPENVVPMKRKNLNKKDLELEAILPLEDGNPSSRKVGKVEGF